MKKKAKELIEVIWLREKRKTMTMMTIQWLTDLKRWSNNLELKFKQNKKMKITKDMNHINHQMLKSSLIHSQKNQRNFISLYNNNSKYHQFSRIKLPKLQLGLLLLVVQNSIKSKIQNYSKNSCKKNKQHLEEWERPQTVKLNRWSQ